MRVPLLIAIAVIIVGGFLVFMMTFTVGFTEKAVVTTFGKAGPDDVVTDPGLKFKWPAPIQSATVYDTRVRLQEIRDETQQTADQRQVVVGAFLTWRVDDPLLFYQRFRGDAGADPREHYRIAERSLESVFRSAMAEVSRYRFDQLFTTEGDSSIASLEDAILSRLNASREQGGGEVSRYGIEVKMVGIKSIELPEQATSEVFEQMRSTREKLAADAESQGQSIAASIRSKAESDVRTILDFAANRAAELQAQGDREAARWLEVQQQAPALAEFMRKVEFLRSGFGKSTNIFFTPNTPGLEVFGPQWMERMEQSDGMSSTLGSPADETADAGDDR
ncbi:MAG: SPFH domain-containing protein [Planctomycetota bacterium]